MNNKSDTNLIRHYCHIHKGYFFDVKQLKRTDFNFISESNFRKYVSRMVEEKELTYIDKGFYYIGSELPLDIDEKIEKRFIGDPYAIYGGEALLWKLGIKTEKPETVTILTSYGGTNRRIKNIQLEYKSFTILSKPLSVILELINSQKLLSEDDSSTYLMKIVELMPTDIEFELNEMSINYPRIVYTRLANYLIQMNISNEVMAWYENKLRNNSCKE